MPVGTFRVVILTQRYALKFPRPRHFMSGMRCNRWEREMWRTWRPVFGWQNLCPVLVADPLGLVVVMPRALQPVTDEDVRNMPDYYPNITAELKPQDYGRIDGVVVALDYGYWDASDVADRRKYYQERQSSGYGIPRPNDLH